MITYVVSMSNGFSFKVLGGVQLDLQLRESVERWPGVEFSIEVSFELE